MALRIETFDNVRGGNTLYKALTHPQAAQRGRAIAALARKGRPRSSTRKPRPTVRRDFRTGSGRDRRDLRSGYIAH
jgi:hypothetical protein